VKETEFKLIIDRERHKNDVQKYYYKHIDFLEDLVNYGSNLIPHSYESSNKKLEDIIIISVLLKQVVAMVDATEVLISNGAVVSAHLQTRAAYEASLYIDWMLRSETEKKARYYYVSNLRNQRLWALRFIKGTHEEEIFSQTIDDLGSYKSNINIKDIEKEAEEQLKSIDEILSKEVWSEINKNYESKKSNKTSTEAHWYKLLGINSIKQLAKELNRLPEYDFYYSKSSDVMHSISYSEHVRFDNGTVIFEPVRSLNDVKNIIFFISLIAFSSYKPIIEKYNPKELKEFAKKYYDDWRDLFLNIPTVTYKNSF
jgi:hypothetical protein